ncbi:MAG TPA: DUF2199 domain-containing protein [Gammaproteobacteria bacterium]
MSFTCKVCGEVHEGLPDIGSDRPAIWWDIPGHEREERIRLGADTCEVDGQYFFLRGVIEIPVHDQPECFGIGAWVSQKRENYQLFVADPGASRTRATFGWLNTELGIYGEKTVGIKCRVLFPGGDLRPLIEVEPGSHPLSLEQRHGITLRRAWEIVHHYDHSARTE